MTATETGSDLFAGVDQGPVQNPAENPAEATQEPLAKVEVSEPVTETISQASSSPVSDASATVAVTTTASGGTLVTQLTDTLKSANGPPAETIIQLGLDANQTFEFDSDLVVNGSDLLKGSGTLTVGVENHGLISPGNSPGIINVPSFSQAHDAKTIIEIGGTAGPGVDPNGWDQINVAGTAEFDGVLEIQLYNGFVPSVGQSFVIFTYANHTGEFSGWLGTTGIPGHPELAFKPTYNGTNLTLEVVQTPIIIPGAQTAIDTGLNTLSQVSSILTGVNSFAQTIPLLGDSLGNLVNMGNMVTAAIQNQINSLWASLPKESQVTTAIQNWHNTTAGGFLIKINGVLGHYGTVGADPFWWDVDMEIIPSAVNRTLQNVADGVLGAVFSSAPFVQVTTKLALSFSFGYDSTFFVKINSMAASAKIAASGLSGFPFNLSPPGGPLSLNVTNGSVSLDATLNATPDASVLTDGRITAATLTSIASSSTNVANAFNLDKTGTLNAQFTLAGALTGFAFSYTGTHTISIYSANLFSGADPDLTLVINGSMNVLGQSLAGTFTLKKKAAETIIEASNVTVDLTLGAGGAQKRVLRATNGTAKFLVVGSELAGSASLTITDGPDIPNLSISGSTVTLTLNSTSGAVPTIDGETVNLPAGPYYRVAGHAVISLTTPQASLTADFVFEPKDTNVGTPGNEETWVGVANLSFNFSQGATSLLTVTNGAGAFVITPTGIYGKATASASLAVPTLSVTGTFTVLLNDTNSAIGLTTVDVNGTEVTIPALSAGPYLRVNATGATAGQHAQLTVLGIALTGDFAFERKTTNNAVEVVTVAASNVSFGFGAVANNLLSITNGSAAFIITPDGLAGQGSVSVGLNVSGLSVGGSFTVRINNTNAPVNETVSINGGSTVINLPAGPYLQVQGQGVTLTVFGIGLTGDFSFEQTQTTSGARLITVRASNVSFNFGTSILSASNGQALFLITDSGMAGQGSIDISVQAFGTGFTQPFDWSFNNMATPLADTVTTASLVSKRPLPERIRADSPAPASLAETFDIPSGPFNRLSSHGPVTLSVDVAGHTQSITAAVVLTLVHPDSGPDYVTVGVSDFSTALGTTGPGSVSLTVGGGTGAFVIYPATPTKLAGEVRVATASFNGTSALSINATNLKVRINNTNGDVGTPTPVVVSISDDPAEDVSIQFSGPYYHNYVAISGAAELVLADFVALGGNFAIEISNSNANQLKVGVTDLHFDLKAGTFTVASFHHGTGAFIITDGGLAGVASLQFQTGVVGISGTINLEVNTTSAAVNTSVTTASGTTNINLTNTHYLLVGVNGFLHLGSVALPFNFNVIMDTASNTVEFRQQGSNMLLVSISSSGAITTGLSFSDFARPGSFEFISMLRQLAEWLSSFRGASIFEVEIPFTGGKTLGDAFDWTQLFVDQIYSHMVSVEITSGSVRKTDPVSGDPLTVSGNLANATFQLQLGTEAPVTVVVNGPYADFDALVALIDAALPAVINTRVEARKNKDDQLVIALTDSEVAKGTALKLVASDDQMNTLGFGPVDSDPNTVEQTGVLLARFNTEEFFAELGTVLGFPMTYNAAQQVYTYDANLTGTYSTTVPFSFSQELGPIGSAELDGQLIISATVGMKFKIGFDLGAREVPRLLSSSQVPVPATGRLSDSAHFNLYINGDLSPITLMLPQGITTGNNNINDLADDLNVLFSGVTYSGFGSPTPLSDLIIAQKAGDGLAISAKDSQLGIINRLVAVSLKDDVFASEMGFGTQISPDGTMFLTASTSQVKGLFIDKVDDVTPQLSASLEVTTDLAYNPNGITGKLKFGFVEIEAGSGRFGTLDYEGNPSPLTVGLTLQNQTTGVTRLYIADLMNGTSSNNIGNLAPTPEFHGSFLAELDDISVGGLGFSFPLGTNPKVGVFIPDIKHLDYNPNPYDPATNNQGMFLTYPDLGNLLNFNDISFAQIINALKAIADNLSQMSAFSFLDERLPLINVSINDMIDYAAKFATLIDNAANGGATSLQETLDTLKTEIDELFNLDPSVLTVSMDTSDILPTALRTTGGVNGSANSATTINPRGDNNGFTIRTTSTTNAADYNGSTIRIVGSSEVTDSSARATWNSTSKTLTIKINPGKTTTNAIITAIGAIPGTPWTAEKTASDNSGGTNTGNGTFTTMALKFGFNFTTAYANSMPFELDLKKLVEQLGGTNSAVAALLDLATTLIQVQGSGNLTVSASATLTLDFGLDVSNPSTIRPFFYDTTGAVMTARVAGTNINIQASLGAVAGIWIKNGTVTLDGDGNPVTGPTTTPPAVGSPASPADNGAEFRLGLRDNNGDGRHYFDENWFSFDNIDLTMKGGVSASLPIFAPFESLALGGLEDNNHDGYADNVLAIDIPDLVRFFVDTRAKSNVADLRIPGGNNDLRITRTVSGVDNFKVVVNEGSVGASFAGDTLTIQVQSGVTTALQVKTAVQALGGFTVAFINNDPSGVNTGAGAMTVSKLTLITPDFDSLFADLELCDIIGNAAGPLLDGLDKLLGTIQDGLNAIVLNTRLPLIGDGLAGAANFISDFRSGLLQQLRDEVAAAGGNGITAIENAIKKAFWNSIGPGGLDLLVDVETGEALDVSLGFSQLDVTLDCDEGLVVNLRLKKEIALVDTSGNPIKLDIGVPGFGLQADGNVKVALGFDLLFGFGFNKEDGFFFNSSAPASQPELNIYFRVTIPSLHFGGTLLFLQLDINDNADSPSLFEGFFKVDLRDPNNDGKLTFAEMSSGGTQFGDIVKAQLGADANVNLDLAASFGGNTAFPRVLAQFHLRWHFDLENGAGDPQITFDNIYLDLGTLISDFLGPILEEIQKVTKPVQPIIDVVTARIPVLSDLAGEDITLLDLAEAFGLLEPSTIDFIEDVIQVIELINKLEGIGEGTILIPFGSFNLASDNSGEMKKISVLNNLSSIDLEQTIANASGPGVSSTYQSATSGFASDVGSLDNFKIPVFDNPAELFNLFVGKPVRLVEWRMPTFKFKFTYTQKIPIYPPLYAQFGGTIGADINIGFGYDTYGIQKFIDDPEKNPIHLLDGFYVITKDTAGNDQAALKLYGEIFAGASIDLLIVEAGVRGGISLTVEFFWNDPDDDGKMRVSEIVANALQDPRCIFNIHGEVTLFLEAYLKIDLFFFSIDKTWRFAEITLVSFDLTCPQPVLGEMSGSTLKLNIGSRASKRLEIDTEDNAETFVVRHVDGASGSETVEVLWGNFKQTFTGVAKVVAEDAGQGDDVVDTRNVLSPVELHGGQGNDKLYLSDGAASTAYGDDGEDTITASSAASATGVTLYGGEGNDTFVAGTVAITIYGGGGNDVIPGSAEADHLYGEGGADNIEGGDGDDYIEGGDGHDTIDAGAGHDLVLAGKGDDFIRAGRDDDIVDGGEGNDEIWGSSGFDLLVGGEGSDKLYGHGGNDLMIGDRVSSVNNLVINETNKGALRTAIIDMAKVPGPAAGITVKGLTGTGNDFIVGNGGSDVMFGGDGDDYLYGGNLTAPGSSEVVEEDGNDFIDGGRNNDTIFGDDSMGRTGDRDTGISIKSSIYYDLNLNGVHDEDELGFGNVTVELWTASNPPGFPGANPIATVQTEIDGAFKFLGLDPNNYIIVFSLPAGLAFAPRTTTDVAAAKNDNDADPTPGPTLGQTAIFAVGYNQTYDAVSAGYTGPSKVSITDVSVNEGTTGQQTQMVFNVVLSGPQSSPVEIEYQTIDGSATSASGDYQAVNPTQTLILSPYVTTGQIVVLITGDTTYEPHEQFELKIVRAQRMDPGAPFNLTLSQPVILGTIVNDDPIPSISIQDYTPVEPETEGAPAKFIVRLSNPSQYTVTVSWRTDAALNFQALPTLNAATPSPLAGADFTMASGTLTFQPGVTSQVITVATINDSLDEEEEEFWVDLYNPAYAKISDNRGYGVILDNDEPVSVSIVPVTPIGGPYQTEVTESTSAPVFVSFTVKLSAPSGKVINVTYGTSPGTAVEGAYSESGELPDYVGLPNSETPEEEQTLVFNPGDPLTKTITVQINPDDQVEGDENFFVNLIHADNANIAASAPAESNHATVVIKDVTVSNVDYGPWSVRFSDIKYHVQEPTSGTAYADITIVRNPASSEAIAVFFTTDGSATAGSDYGSIFRRLVYFRANEVTKTIRVPIYADGTVEGDETVKLHLLNPTGGPVRAEPDNATLVIHDGNTPQVAIRAPTYSLFPIVIYGVNEGSSGGTMNHNFVVYLYDPLTNTYPNAGPGGVTVSYTTVSLTARAGQDFLAASGTVTIPYGVNFVNLPIAVVEDTTPELNETFAVRISNPVGATLAPTAQSALATIYDDDLTPITGVVFYDSNGNGFKDINEKGIKDVDVTISYKQGTSTVTVPVTTTASGVYTANVLLGSVTVKVDGESVTSPWKGFILLGSGTYQTTTNNETQTVKYEGIVGLPAFADVGYRIKTTFSVQAETNKDVGRGGTDDTIFGGPGDDVIDAGAGDDHVVGGHWMTATDGNVPINLGSYDAVVTATTDPPTALHPVYDSGPIFAVDTSGLNTGGSISGEIWLDANNNGIQDAGELFTGEDVVVTLFDCDGNPINALVTNNGTYKFERLFLQAAPSEYVVQFDLPKGYKFAGVVAASASVNNDVVVSGRTTIVSISNATPVITNLDAGILPSDIQPVGGLQFSDASYSVSESVKGGYLIVTVVRGNSYTSRPVVVHTEDGTAMHGVNYQPASVLLEFGVGETVKTVKIRILDTDSLGFCSDPLVFNLVLRDPTGRPLDSAPVYIGGDSFGSITDDDTIQGGDDWDILLGDSGNIPAPTVIDPTVPYNNLSGIVYSGGPGKDTISGGNGPDFVHGQLGDDILTPGSGQDIVYADMGSDVINVDLDDDVIEGGYNYDTVISTRDVPIIELTSTGATTAVLVHRTSVGAPMSTFTLKNVEMARLFGGAMDNTFKISSWDGSAFLVGAGGNDTLEVTKDSDVILKDATAFDSVLFYLLYGFFKDAAISLPSGSTYHLSSLENVVLTDGAGDRTLDASAYSRPVTFVGTPGNDTLIGGSANDTFRYNADSVLGTDTLTGNGGRDLLDFSAGTVGVTVDLSVLAPTAQVVNANLSLKLADKIENLTGSAGNDTLTGNDLNNVLIGGAGTDTLAGGAGSETYAFDTDTPQGSKTIVENIADPGNDTLDFSGTTLYAINLNMGVLGTAQTINEHLTLTLVGEGIEQVIGGSRDDVIRGNSNKNVLRGGPGNDLLDGKSGDDVLDGGTGNNTLIGGLGVDRINVQGDTNWTLTDVLLTRGTGQQDTLESIEVVNLRGGTSANVFDLTGFTGTGSVHGGDDPTNPRNDTLIVAADANIILTDSSLDISINFAPITLVGINTAILTDGPGSHTLDASGFSGITVLSGGEGDDTLIGGSGPDLIRGGPGSDKLTGGPGNDILDGGTDNNQLLETRDAYRFVIKNNQLLVDLTAALVDDEYDWLINLTSASLTGGAGNNVFDVSNWTAGPITVDGQGGTDVLQATMTASGLVQLTNTGLYLPNGSVIGYAGIEGVIVNGSEGDDVFDASGYNGIVYFYGLGGNDTFIAGPGSALLDGGEGSDRFEIQQYGALHLLYILGGEGVDTLDFSAFTVPVTVNLATVGAIQGVHPVELQLYLAAEDLENLVGGAGADTLTGNSLDNEITGGPGVDTINGLGGTNTVVEAKDGNFVLTNTTLSINGEVDTLANLQRARLTGGASGNTMDASAFTLGSVVIEGGEGDDILIGGAEDDTLIGGAGNDLLRGGNGNDIYLFDADTPLGKDTVDEVPSAGGGLDRLDFSATETLGVTVNLSVTGAQTVNANLELVLTSDSSIEWVIGTNRDDQLTGNSLDNYFISGQGNDQIDGRGGLNTLWETRDANFTLTDSSLVISDSSGTETKTLANVQQAILFGGASDNFIDASAFTLGAVYLNGFAGNDTLYGGYKDDYLVGNDGNDTLYGGAGADTLQGGAGNDILQGAGVFDTALGADGNDQLYGGLGNDTFLFDLSSTTTEPGIPLGMDTVYEYAGEGFADTLQGVGLSGIAVNLFSVAPQNYYDVNGNLILTLVLSNPGRVEFSF